MPAGDLWDPMKLVRQFSLVWVVAISNVHRGRGDPAVNIAANVVSPANDFANAFPGGSRSVAADFLTGVIGLLMQPGACSPTRPANIFKWLVGYRAGWLDPPGC